MFNKTVLTALLLTGASLAVKAQYIHYDPIPTPPPAGSSTYDVPPSYRQSAHVAEVQRVSGYIIDPATSRVRKVSLQISVADRTVYIVGVKELTSQYWTSFSTIRPVAQKLNSYDSYADSFEYKVYMPTLGQTVYF